MSIAIDRERLQLEFAQACSELREAEAKLDAAEPRFVDAAVYNVTACRARRDALIREYREMFGNGGVRNQHSGCVIDSGCVGGDLMEVTRLG